MIYNQRSNGQCFLLLQLAGLADLNSSISSQGTDYRLRTFELPTEISKYENHVKMITNFKASSKHARNQIPPKIIVITRLTK